MPNIGLMAVTFEIEVHIDQNTAIRQPHLLQPRKESPTFQLHDFTCRSSLSCSSSTDTYNTRYRLDINRSSSVRHQAHIAWIGSLIPNAFCKATDLNAVLGAPIL